MVLPDMAEHSIGDAFCLKCYTLPILCNKCFHGYVHYAMIKLEYGLVYNGLCEACDATFASINSTVW